MMATTLTWIYADRLQHESSRRYKIKGRAGFAFSNVRRIIAEEASSSLIVFAPCRGNPHKNLSSRPYYAWWLSEVLGKFIGNFRSLFFWYEN